VVVIDISRNLLLIMSNLRHLAHYNEVNYLCISKYPAFCAAGRIYILNGFSELQRIISKLFIVSILDTKLLGWRRTFFVELGRKASLKLFRTDRHGGEASCSSHNRGF
jgi:hypothetical protein